MKKIWFKAKTYGYGWYPATWQGWLVIGIYFVMFTILAAIYCTNIPRFINYYLFSVLVITAILIYICYRTGEPAHWRWGDKK